MWIIRDDFNRILRYGGFFVIFSEPRYSGDLIWGEKKYTELHIVKGTSLDNWSFLDIFSNDNIEIESISGEEINIPSKDHILYDFLRKNAEDIKYSAKFKPTYSLHQNWSTILTNKFGHNIAGIIGFNDEKGRCLVLPQMSKTPSQILSLVKEVLPEISPHLFPYYEGVKWIIRDEYEIPPIVSLKKDIEEIRNSSQKEIENIKKNISLERDKFNFLHNILIQGDDELVDSLINALHYIGFQKIVNVDSKEDEKNKQEDVQVLDFSPNLLIEIKGLSSLPKEGDVLQVHKYVSRRMKEWKKTDIGGVFIVNHQKNLPPLDRDNKSVFTKQQIEDAKENDILLITTLDLYLVIKAMLKWDWSFENIKDNFYEKGRFSIIPAHYKIVGEINNFYDEINVISVELSDNINVSDKIGFITPLDFLEEELSSLQINKTPVDSADSGSIVGIKTCFTKSQLKKGMKVYKII